MSKIPTTLFGRGAKLFKIAGKVALEEASRKLSVFEDEKEKLKKRVELAQDVVKTLSHLKGASMKLGQLLSLDLGEYLPPEITKVLEELHQKSTFLPYKEIERILKHELGEKFEDLRDISEIPIAAASIGQVHKAYLRGKPIVLKIQYPGVAESIPSDIKILELILNQGRFFQNKRETDIKPFLSEVKEVLLKEADYLHELKMHALYRKKFESSPYIIPEIYPEYSTTKVLAQEFITGVSITNWLEQNPPFETRQNFANLLIRLYLTEIFQNGIVQTDPNPGNFFVTSDNKIGLLDFGAAKEYSPEFVESYRKVLIAAFNRDHETVISESIKVGFLDAREDQSVRDIYAEMMDFLSDPFRHDHDFDFTDKNYFTKSRDLSWEMTKRCRYTPPPKDLLFLHRKLAFIFIFIRKMDVKIRLKDYWHYVEET